jgi:hypothetical protein
MGADGATPAKPRAGRPKHSVWKFFTVAVDPATGKEKSGSSNRKVAVCIYNSNHEVRDSKSYNLINHILNCKEATKEAKAEAAKLQEAAGADDVAPKDKQELLKRKVRAHREAVFGPLMADQSAVLHDDTCS